MKVNGSRDRAFANLEQGRREANRRVAISSEPGRTVVVAPPCPEDYRVATIRVGAG